LTDLDAEDEAATEYFYVAALFLRLYFILLILLYKLLKSLDKCMFKAILYNQVVNDNSQNIVELGTNNHSVFAIYYHLVLVIEYSYLS